MVMVLVASLSASAKPGQQTKSLRDLTLEQLGKVEVTTVSKQPQEVWQTAAAIYVISHDDIVRSGATTIPEALRLAPGVEVARIDSNKWSVGIRGFGSRLARSVLVLIDGRTVYTTLFAGTYWEVQDTLLQDVDRIEVIRGPGGTIWGPNAVNGVINIITKPASETHGIFATAGGGNLEQGFFGVRYGGQTSGGIDYRAYVKGFNRGPEFHPDGKNFDDWRAGQGGFRADWSPASNDHFTVQGDIYDEAAGERVQATTYSPPATTIIDGDARLSGGNIMGRWHRVLAQDHDLQLQAYYDRTNRHEPNFGDLRDTFDVDFVSRQPLPARQQLSWGAGARFSRGHQLEVVSGLTFDPSETTDQLLTAFVQDQIALIAKRLTLIGGTKLLHTNFTGAELEPTARILWTPTEKQSVWAAFTRAVRTPADVERNFFLSGYLGQAPNGLPFFARFNANRNFQPEELRGYEAGYRRLFGQEVYLDVAAFFNQYHRLFSEDITGPVFLEDVPAPPHLLLPAEFGNGLKGTTEGGEIAPEWRPLSYFRLRGSYSFLEMHIRKVPGSTDVGSAPGIVGSSPQHQVYVQSSLDLPRSVLLDLMYRYVSALPGQQVRAYHTGDARLAWQWRGFTFAVVGRNLLQPYHYEFGADPGFVGIKRTVYAKVAWSR